MSELRALVLYRNDVIAVVNALRRYRAAAAELLSKRYGDGECDAVALLTFEQTIAAIEEEAFGPEGLS